VKERKIRMKESKSINAMLRSFPMSASRKSAKFQVKRDERQSKIKRHNCAMDCPLRLFNLSTFCHKRADSGSSQSAKDLQKRWLAANASE
jgi:hypothetical protein